MEMKFENKVTDCYREVFHQLKRVQESAESVVPDTDDDIGKIASVQTNVYLKGKDIGSRGVTITGEAEASLLYVNENENRVSNIHISKPFSMEYEIGDMPPEPEALVNLSVSNAEARVLNPRKVSVTFEISSELSLFSLEEMEAELILPEEPSPSLHFKFEGTEAEIPVSVCEKTFALNEQYIFPSDKTAAEKLIYEHCSFKIEDQQFIGSKVIIKGCLINDVCYIPAGETYPQMTRFTSSFSQIIDSGNENIESCSALICLTSAYFELTDTISGEKALDAEIHALVQLTGRRKVNINYISDAYCNIMPASCSLKSEVIPVSSGIAKINTDINEEISFSDDCAELLCTFINSGPISTVQSELSFPLNLDIIYKTVSGTLASVKRVLSINEKFNLHNARYLSSEFDDINIKAEGDCLNIRLKAELSFETLSSKELNRVTSIELDEEKMYDMSKFPSLSLVHQESESIWELAAAYRSSPEAIERCNSGSEGEKGGLLLIPKEI